MLRAREFFTPQRAPRGTLPRGHLSGAGTALMSNVKKGASRTAGGERFYSKTIVVPGPDGKPKRLTFYADKPEDLDIVTETMEPARKANPPAKPRASGA
jgi:hypothetical protein